MTPEEREKLLSPEHRELFNEAVMAAFAKNQIMSAQNEKLPIWKILLQRRHWFALKRHLELLMELEAMHTLEQYIDSSCSSKPKTEPREEDEFDFSNFDPDCEAII